VSRSTDKIDVVTTDADGRIQTSAWEPKFGWDWAAWRAIGDLRVARGAAVNAVSKHPDQLDVFAIGTDGRVHTAAWQPSFGADWRGWWPIG
jgi:hypothetical protein